MEIPKHDVKRIPVYSNDEIEPVLSMLLATHNAFADSGKNAIMEHTYGSTPHTKIMYPYTTNDNGGVSMCQSVIESDSEEITAFCLWEVNLKSSYIHRYSFSWCGGDYWQSESGTLVLFPDGNEYYPADRSTVVANAEDGMNSYVDALSEAP